MVKSRLEIGGVNVGFSQELNISQNMVIADVREPDKRNATFSKTVIVPGSPEIKRLFEFIFNVNATLDSFNPNLKTPAKYFVNEVMVFNGHLQLLRINNKYVNDYESTEFECSLIGVSGNLFLAIAGLYLTDIDFSDLDHAFTFTSSMFAPAVLGTGYAYGYQDYGLQVSGAPQTTTWAFRYLKPLFFEREIVRRIFTDAGYTWETSGYFDSDYEKHIVIPDVNEGALKMADSDRVLNECYIGISPDYSGSGQAGTYDPNPPIVGFKYFANNISVITPVPFNDESTPYNDVNSLWDSITNFKVTINDGGYYTLSSVLNVNLVIDTFPAGAIYWGGTTNLSVYELQVEFQKSTDGGSTWSNIGNFPQAFFLGGVFPANNYATTLSGQLPSVILSSGDQIRVSLVQGTFNAVAFADALFAPVTSGTTQIHFEIQEGSSFSCTMATRDLIEGQTVRMNDSIPKNVTQLDFLTSIIKSENLYFDVSKTVKNQYIVETREDFIETSTSNAIDWTDKWDISKTEEIIPMGELDWNRLIFTYKSDRDYFNMVYEDTYKEVYGTETRNVNNDHIRKDKKIELAFSATPIAGSTNTDIVAPRYFNLDEQTGIVSPTRCNIRRLYWGGLLSCNSHQFITGSSINYRTTYPFVGHVDNPKNPTVDLSFDNPLELYWKFPGNLYTDNNRYNERYSKFISEITDQDSKIVIRWFYLTENDIYKFSFSNLIFVRDAYFLINKIVDYNPQANQVTKVEMLKLKAGSVFVPSHTIPVDELGGDNTSGSGNRQSNTNNGTGIIIGTGNFNNGESVLIIGDGNIIN